VGEDLRDVGATKRGSLLALLCLAGFLRLLRALNLANHGFNDLAEFGPLQGGVLREGGV